MKILIKSMYFPDGRYLKYHGIDSVAITEEPNTVYAVVWSWNRNNVCGNPDAITKMPIQYVGDVNAIAPYLLEAIQELPEWSGGQIIEANGEYDLPPE